MGERGGVGAAQEEERLDDLAKVDGSRCERAE